MARPFKAAPAAALAAITLALGACGHNPYGMQASLSDRECMARVMYFESNRSSDEGMLAVGTVVMNRLQSSRYPKTICGVVAQQNQFAEGALSKPVGGRSYAKALQVADAVIAGHRHPGVGGAMFFHTAGYTYPYRNMAYVVAAGGNVFYEKRTPGTFEPVHPTLLAAQANDARLVGTKPIRVATVSARHDADEEDATPAGRPPRIARPAPVEPTARTRPKPTQVASAAADDEEEDDVPRAPRAGSARATPSSGTDLVLRPRPQPTRSASSDDEEDDEPAPSRMPPRRPVLELDRPLPRERKPVVVAAVGPPAGKSREKAAPPSIAELIELDLERPRRGAR